jgi:ketosteroid isomerase-like protein
MATIQEMRDALQLYLAACESRDIDRIAGSFAQDAIVEDPTIGRIAGLDNIRRYFQNLYGDLISLRLSVGRLYWRGNSAACFWRGSATRVDGTAIQYEGIDVLTLNEKLKISHMSAYWDPKDFAADMV